MYWNVNALTRLSFAEHGRVLLSAEPFADLDAPPQITATLADLDFADHHRGKNLMGLVAVQRFTGHGITAEDLARIQAADIGFRIVPDLPTLYPHRPQPRDPLGPATQRTDSHVQASTGHVASPAEWEIGGKPGGPSWVLPKKIAEGEAYHPGGNDAVQAGGP